MWSPERISTYSGLLLSIKVNILINGVCRPVEPFAGIPCFHMRCKNRHTAVFLIQIPWNPNPDMLIQTQRLILCQHADGIHAGVNAVAQRKIDDTISPPYATAGFATFLVNTPRRLPCPPARSIAIISFLRILPTPIFSGCIYVTKS